MKNTPSIILINRITLAVITITLFIFPLLFLTNTTEAFVLPKQIFLVISSSILLTLWGVSGIIERKLIVKNSPLNIPVFLFGIIVVISSFVSRNMYDSLAISIPVLAGAILYFVIINTISDKKAFLIAFAGFLAGAVASTVISIFYNFNIFFLPIAAIDNRYFSTFGSPVQHLIYIVPIVIIGVFSLLSEWKSKRALKGNANMVLYTAGGILLIGVGIFAYQLITAPQKPIFLPYSYGFQIAAAALSQDTSRLLFALPFGSGYGTFLTNFTRYKAPEINLDPNLWAVGFTSSSSFVLEIVATTGILGLLSYLFIIAKLLKTRSKEANPLFFALLALFATSFFLPFTLVNLFLMFVLLSFYVSYLFLLSDRRVYDVAISIVALRRGLISFEDVQGETHSRKKESLVFPVFVLVLIVLVSGFVSYQSFKLYSADAKMAASLSQANRNNGQAVYDLQLSALNEYPYRSDYYRIFSQINLALANSIVSGIPEGSTIPESSRQTVTTLLQQSVNNARTAVAIAPITSLNWENLSQIYRSLIGVSQGAEDFTILTMNQAIALDPSNPLLRIELGGVYYQLSQHDAAQQQFIAAIQLKPDLANAYYNLANSQEVNNQLPQALSSYEATLRLVTNEDDKKLLDEKIASLRTRVSNPEGEEKLPEAAEPNPNQPPLGVNTPAAPIPTSAAQVKVSPPPTGAVQISPTPTPEPEE